jgi:diguanylate cyclase (GGDEF)-like protein
LKKFFFYFVILFGMTWLNSYAQTLDEAIRIKNNLYQSPWESYQKINAMETGDLNTTDKLWWLLQKAEAEELLYFYDKFEQTVNLALSFTNESTQAEIISRLYYFQGLIYSHKNEYSQSISILQRAHAIAQQEKLIQLSITIKQDIAYVRSLTELYDVSFKELQLAYVKAFSIEDHFLIANINDSYGAIYGYMGDYAKSIEYHQKALDTYKKLGYPAHISEAIYGLAATYRYWGKFDLAIDYYRLYLDGVSYTPNKEIAFYAIYGLGITLAEKGNCTEALTVIDDALQYPGQPDFLAELYKKKASCLLSLDNVVAAEEALLLAKNIFDNLSDLKGTVWQLEVNKIAAQLSYQQGDHQQAYSLLHDYYQTYSQVLATNSSERMIRVRGTFEQERKNVEIALLQQRSEVQALKIAQEKQKNVQQGYFITFIICIFIIAMGILVIQRRYNQKILALSIRDPLSNLYNRRYIFDYMDKLIKYSDVSKLELSVIMFDIDNFKLVNDHYGHSMGDVVIQKLAGIGLTVLRSEDIMGRVGGEEFFCILPRTNVKQCRQVAVRMLKGIRSFSFESKTVEPFSVTVSMGIATISEECTNGNTLYEQAEKALYQSKLEGKNKITVFTE